MGGGASVNKRGIDAVPGNACSERAIDSDSVATYRSSIPGASTLAERGSRRPSSFHQPVCFFHQAICPLTFAPPARPYGFGLARFAPLALLTFTALSGSRSCGVVITKFSDHAVTRRSSPTVFADTSISSSASTCIESGKPPSATCSGNVSGFASHLGFLLSGYFAYCRKIRIETATQPMQNVGAHRHVGKPGTRWNRPRTAFLLRVCCYATPTVLP
jgi:hypothetical protein